MHAAKCNFMLMLAVVLPGCGHHRTTARLAGDHIQNSQPHALVLGWFVESDGRGRSGYQAAYAASSSATPQTVPLYGSMDEFRAALQKKEMTNIESISDYCCGGWKIRGLTLDELKEL